MMLKEAGEAAAAVQRFLDHNQATLEALGRRLRDAPRSLVVTCARGSSDHAATYAKYLIEAKLGVMTASISPSVTTLLDGRGPASRGALCIAISQSGRSPDLIEAVRAQRDAGAHVVALVNDESSPLFALADTALPLMAGEERSVAATKSFIVALAGIAALVAAWGEDRPLQDRLRRLPADLQAAFAQDWSAGIGLLSERLNLFVIGRGYGLAVAQEAALKLKETCGLHAEAYSSAEVRHGPMRIVEHGFPVLGFATSDAAGADVIAAAAEFAGRGARTLVARAGAADGEGGTLPVQAGCPELEPILMIQSFYRMVESLARSMALNPDEPPYLRKVTTTR